MKTIDPASPSVTFGVSFFAVFLGYSLCTKEKAFCCLQGRSEGLFRKMTLVFPCFAVCATYEQVSLSHAYMGRFPGNSLVLAKYPNENDTLKMTLGRARIEIAENWLRRFRMEGGAKKTPNMLTTQGRPSRHSQKQEARQRYDLDLQCGRTNRAGRCMDDFGEETLNPLGQTPKPCNPYRSSKWHCRQRKSGRA